MPWYTWVFSGVGAAIAAPVVAWIVSLTNRKPTAQIDAEDRKQLVAHPVEAPERQPDAPARMAKVANVTQVLSGQPASSADERLLDFLLAIPGMDDPEFRHLAYRGVPAPVVEQLQIDKRARIELIGLIDTFRQYPHLSPWRKLLNRLNVLLPQHVAVRKLAELLTQLGLIDTS
jgi:hypothetical protein